ncbi:hypothetical protein E2C01_045939 [Portunus trituberculatus]|uniref:Uncharacterized protein n=1 Tax=Portunus trituberculatus TaxID=210409 RepID=A0A5B7G4F9_PORTR|nr:hypothetical protein [Portunus trituberculatus]
MFKCGCRSSYFGLCVALTARGGRSGGEAGRTDMAVEGDGTLGKGGCLAKDVELKRLRKVDGCMGVKEVWRESMLMPRGTTGVRSELGLERGFVWGEGTGRSWEACAVRWAQGADAQYPVGTIDAKCRVYDNGKEGRRSARLLGVLRDKTQGPLASKVRRAL